MPPLVTFETVRALTRQLPFDLDDTEAAARVYARFRETERHADREIVELWAYTFVLRYVYSKFLRELDRPPSDADALITEAFGRVVARLDTVRDPERFPAWVSVVCKNAFRSYLRRAPGVGSLDEEMDLEADATEPCAEFDAPIVTFAIRRAFDRLPAGIREIARGRLLDDRSYEDLSDLHGKPVPILRSYVHKALVALRADGVLRAVISP